jgi:uncharacterized membrane protein YdjX (TVP38/TMEM64 family)
MKNKSTTCKEKSIMCFFLNHKALTLAVVLLGLLILVSYNRGGISNILLERDFNSVVDFVESFGYLSLLIFIILVIVEVIVAPIPSVILYAVGGILFGTFLGGAGALLGNIIGAWIAFEIARRYGRKIVENKIDKKKLKQFDKFSRKYGSHAIFLLRINPITSSDIFSYLAGLTKMPAKQLILGTAWGLVPLVFVQSYFGSDVIKGNPLLTKIFIIVSIVYIIVFFYWIYYIKKKK